MTKFRIVNGHYQLLCGQRLDLKRLKSIVKNGTLYLARPTMLSCHLLGKRTQFFPNGTIQILAGGMSPRLLQSIHGKIYHLLNLYASPLHIHLNQWTVTNLVITFNLQHRFLFNKLVCNGRLSYEPELFPALLLSKVKAPHITLFPNGKGVITGIRQCSEAISALQEALIYIKSRV